MRKKSLYPRLAGQSIVNNRRFFVPYGLTLLGEVDGQQVFRVETTFTGR